MLHQQVKDEIKQAMLARDTVRLLVVRGLAAAFTNELVAKRRKPDEALSDEEALAVIRREASKRKDSMAQFRAGGREDLAVAEEAELKILETYLPPEASVEEIKKIILAKKAELGIADKSGSGRLVGAVMKELKGQADGAAVKAAVEELLT